MRDLQQGKVYKWEMKAIAPHDYTKVDFNAIEAIVKYVWDNEGLKYPPIVKLMAKQKLAGGTGNRNIVQFPESTYTWIILHELSHAMTCNVNGESNQHGALFLGIYMQLASRYLKIPMNILTESADKDGLRFNLEAKPAFV